MSVSSESDCDGDGGHLAFILVLYGAFGGLGAISMGLGFSRHHRELSPDPCSISKLLIVGGIILGLAAAWPILFCWMIVTSLIPSAGQRPLTAARPPAESRVQSSPPVPRTWRDRGRLIMIRARHRRSLTRPKGFMAKLRQLREGRRKYSLEISTTTSDRTLSPGNQDASSDMELAEEGTSTSGKSFRRAVVTVVEIQEEGLFRHIIAYL